MKNWKIKIWSVHWFGLTELNKIMGKCAAGKIAKHTCREQKKICNAMFLILIFGLVYFNPDALRISIVFIYLFLFYLIFNSPVIKLNPIAKSACSLCRRRWH